MPAKTRSKKPAAPLTQKEFRAAISQIDAHIKSTDASLRKSRMLGKKMGPDIEALKRMVADE